MEERILMLLQIMDLAKNWPQFQALHDAARAELVEANAEAAAQLAESTAEASRKAEAKQAKASAKAEEARR